MGNIIGGRVFEVIELYWDNISSIISYILITFYETYTFELLIFGKINIFKGNLIEDYRTYGYIYI